MGRPLLALVLVFVLLSCSSADAPQASSSDEASRTLSEAGSEATPEKPNIVFVIFDDAEAALFEKMPNISSLVRDQGATFDNYYVTDSICCPSRSTIFLGEYVHNHRVWNNGAPTGGWRKYAEMGHQRRGVNKLLQEQGYRTGLFGKYLNEYGPATNSQNHVPPHWDEWFSHWGAQRYNWDANSNGSIVEYGNLPKAYRDDVVGRRALSWTVPDATALATARKKKRGSVQSLASSPAFAYVSFMAPHYPYDQPPPDHTTEFAGERVGRTPSYNEADVSDKPAHIRNLAPLGADNEAAIDAWHRQRLRQMLSGDDFVGDLIARLEARGELENTYVVVTSDNGYQMGQHRIRGKKSYPYEESTKMPLYVRGPNIEPGTRVGELAANTDLYATFAEIAGASWSGRDGRSLLGPLTGAPSGRESLLLENPGGFDWVRDYYGVVDESFGTRYKYVEYATGEKELYDLDADPYETESLHATADPALLSALKARLEALKACAGEACRAAED